MGDAPAPKPRKPRTIRKRKRFIPNAKPGYEGLTVEAAEKPQPVEPMAQTVGGDSLPREPMYVPKGILAIDRLSKGDDLSEDMSLLTPEQRKFWNGAKARHRKIKAEHKRAFLDALMNVPSVAAAARASGFRERSWYCLRARDAVFAAEWEQAIESGVAKLEHAATVRAFHGVERPIYQNGQRVGSELVMSDRLAEVMLRRYKPELYSEKMMVSQTVNGRLDVVHHLSPALEAMAAKVLAVGGPTIEGKAELVDQAPDLVAQVMGRVSLPKPQDVVDNGTAQRAEDERTS